MEKKIIVFGSSISAGCWDSLGGWAERIKKDVNQLVNEGSDEYWGMVYNQSISGDTSTGIVSRFETEAIQRIGTNQKIYLIFEIGINDSLYINSEQEFQIPLDEFSKNIDQLISKSSFADEVLFIGAPAVVDNLLDPIPWHPTGTYATKYTEQYNEVLKIRCKEHGHSYCDIFSEFKNGDVAVLMSPDGVHPSTKGHDIYYSLMKDKLHELGAFSKK